MTHDPVSMDGRCLWRLSLGGHRCPQPGGVSERSGAAVTANEEKAGNEKVEMASLHFILKKILR